MERANSHEPYEPLHDSSPWRVYTNIKIPVIGKTNLDNPDNYRRLVFHQFTNEHLFLSDQEVEKMKNNLESAYNERVNKRLL